MLDDSRYGWRRRALGVLRVSVFFGVVNLLALPCILPVARAAAEEKLQERGLKLLQELGPALLGPPETAAINGQRMSLAFKATELPVADVLARVERYCAEHSRGLAGEIAKLPEARSALGQLPLELRDPSRWFVSRQGAADGSAGQVMCLSRREGRGGLAGLVSRIMTFLDTGDLAALGDARYVVARRDAATGETHVLAIWTDGPFNIPSMFPESGDAPGADSAVVPRPPDSRRVFSAEIEGNPYALRMYDSRHSQSDVLRHYTETLPARGFQELSLPSSQAGHDLSNNASAFVRRDSALIVVVNDTDEELTAVTLIEMGGRGFVRAASAGGTP